MSAEDCIKQRSGNDEDDGNSRDINLWTCAFLPSTSCPLPSIFSSKLSKLSRIYGDMVTNWNEVRFKKLSNRTSTVLFDRYNRHITSSDSNRAEIVKGLLAINLIKLS